MTEEQKAFAAQFRKLLDQCEDPYIRSNLQIALTGYEKVCERKTREELETEWDVLPPGTWENETGPKDWYAVSNDTGIVAYFGTEEAAFRFRDCEFERLFKEESQK